MTVLISSQKLRAAIRRPAPSLLTWYARRNPYALAARHSRLARRVGVDRVYLVLSFDCDTDADAEVAASVHERLAKLGVVPVYAVPGELLRRGEGVYTQLAREGAEFLNHGGVEHTYFDEALQRQRSCFFYDELEPARVAEDIEKGHELVTDIIGDRPAGFRTPHFGTYQRAGTLQHLYSVLRRLGYRFSTSTTPRFALRNGPAFRRNGVVELPVTGTPTAPLEILDTWGFFAAPDRINGPADYLRQAELLAHAMHRFGAGVINVYGDPAHIHAQPEFFEAIEAWTRVAQPISYGALLDRIAA
jgi:peptidoglycan/xylan/chitin deacetylase (PgdA/CDA1 family)